MGTSPYLDQMTSSISFTDSLGQKKIFKTSKIPYIKVSNKYIADSLQTKLGSIVVNIVKYQDFFFSYCYCELNFGPILIFFTPKCKVRLDVPPLLSKRKYCSKKLPSRRVITVC